MQTHAREGIALDRATRFLFCSRNSDVAQRLGQALGDLGLLVQESPSADALVQRTVALNPQVVFLDFTQSDTDPGSLLASADLAHILARVAPSVPRVAVGYMMQPDGAIAALRAGVTDFVDPSVSPEEVREVVQRLIAGHGAESGHGVRRSVLLVGARPGVGTSTLAVHAAGLAQERLMQAALGRLRDPAGKPARPGSLVAAQLPLSDRVGLLDLGYPIADCLLYLNVSSEFDFAEGVRNLNRLDGTLLNAALAHTASGISAIALPRDLGQMRSVSPSDSLMLFERLRQHCGLLLTDAGGCPDPDFVAKLARASGQVWLVTDQSVSALVALAETVRELERQHVEADTLKLVVNRYDERYGMSAAQIAERFGVALAGTLPDRTLPLMVCMNQGRLLLEQGEREVYMRAVQHLLDPLMTTEPAPRGGRSAGWLANWLPGVHKRTIAA